jgi:hypothetical protein
VARLDFVSSAALPAVSSSPEEVLVSSST